MKGSSVELHRTIDLDVLELRWFPGDGALRRRRHGGEGGC